MHIKFKKLFDNSYVPVSGTISSAGYDLFACITEDITIKPHDIVMIPTGIAIEIPNGYFGMVCSRSGLTSKHGIHVLNSPGIIDSDYRGELKCIIHNCSNNAFVIQSNTKIAQLVIIKYESIQWIESNDLSCTDRGIQGFGSTGM
ncbi:MAG: dUTP diphosphatase [Alphaproteobacteria bacterium]|nr:dUTP diphosphatase [Alphaproteobacteria bacterium]